MNKAQSSLCPYEPTSCIPQYICLGSKLIFSSHPCYGSYLPVIFHLPSTYRLRHESRNSVTFVTLTVRYGVQATRRLIIQPSPLRSYLHTVRSEHSPEHTCVRHTQCEIPSFALPQDIVCYCTFMHFNRHWFGNERLGQHFLK